MNQYGRLFRFFGFHILISFVSQIICAALPIPGSAAALETAGIILLAGYAAVSFVTVSKCTQKEMTGIEAFKLLLIAAALITLATYESRLNILSLVMLMPFRPLILYQFRSGLNSIIMFLLSAVFIETVCYLFRCKKTDSQMQTE